MDGGRGRGIQHHVLINSKEKFSFQKILPRKIMFSTFFLYIKLQFFLYKMCCLLVLSFANNDFLRKIDIFDKSID